MVVPEACTFGPTFGLAALGGAAGSDGDGAVRLGLGAGLGGALGETLAGVMGVRDKLRVGVGVMNSLR